MDDDRVSRCAVNRFQRMNCGYIFTAAENKENKYSSCHQVMTRLAVLLFLHVYVTRRVRKLQKLNISSPCILCYTSDIFKILVDEKVQYFLNCN
jgi:hypothetical protein